MASADAVSAVRRRLQLTNRSTLITLAKTYDIKANLASKVIMEKLIEKGYGLDSFEQTPHIPMPQAPALHPSKRKIDDEQAPSYKRPCMEVPQPGPSSLQALRPAVDPICTQYAQDYACSPATYFRIHSWRNDVFRSLTSQTLSSAEADPSGFFSPEKDDSLDCPDHSREYQCYKCVPRSFSLPAQHTNSLPRRQATSLPPSLAHLLNPESPQPQITHPEKQSSGNEVEAPWDELEPTDSSSLRHFRVRLSQHSPQSPQGDSSSHPHHTQVTLLRPSASTVPPSRTISHSHSQSFGRTTDSLERTTPSHSYPNTPTPVAAAPPVNFPRIGEYIPGYSGSRANDDEMTRLLLQEQPQSKMDELSFHGLPSPAQRTPTKLFQPVTNHPGNQHPYIPIAYNHLIPPPFTAPRYGYNHYGYLLTPATTTNPCSHQFGFTPGLDTSKLGERPHTPFRNSTFNFRVPFNGPLTSDENLGQLYQGPYVGDDVSRPQPLNGLKSEHIFLT